MVCLKKKKQNKQTKKTPTTLKKKSNHNKKILEELFLWTFFRLTSVIWLPKAVGAEFDNTTALFVERHNLKAAGGGLIGLQGKVDTERTDIGADYYVFQHKN